LKIKEMDDEEYAYQAMQDPLYRVETGNYEYRLILRCRQEAKKRFASLRADVLVKLELLDQKHVSDMIQHLQRLLSAMAKMNTESLEILKANQLFPLDVDLSGNQTFNYPDPNSSPYQDQDEEEDDDDDENENEEDDRVANVADMIAKEAILDLGPAAAPTASPTEPNANSNHNKSSNLHDLLSLE
jgi:tRNA U34 5-carboxymethylaminomethyl modifying enzyme MnmG/GidA